MTPRPAHAYPLSAEALDQTWADLNAKYFQGKLPPIPIQWSARLTASVGMFASRVGPRIPDARAGVPLASRRVIRLSLPLLKGQPDLEIIATLAHEMIHQWQYDVLKRRPDHGPDFTRMMAVMNDDGWGITVRHNLDAAVQALTKYTWRCEDCGRDYHRQRRTIRPRHHRCGDCSGRLREIAPAHGAPHQDASPAAPPEPPACDTRLPARATIQLPLPLGLRQAMGDGL